MSSTGNGSIVLFQWMVILGLVIVISLQYTYIHNLQDNIYTPHRIGKHILKSTTDAGTEIPVLSPQNYVQIEESINSTNNNSKDTDNLLAPTKRKQYSGVAVTTFLGAPKWFQNRYSLMVGQVLAMLEDDWIVQIFYDPSQKMALEGISYPGIQRQIRKERVILTPLPTNMKKMKKNALLLTSWFWENIVAEKILLFGGTSALCANSNYDILNFTERFDYIGAPWGGFQGMGGEGGVTVRLRSAMLRVATSLEKDLQEKDTTIGNAKEDSVFVRALLDTKAGFNSTRVATKQDTESFAAAGRTARGKPLAVSGTLPGLNDQQRQDFLEFCPEMKMMFPTLHNAACFGAEPNALECFKYLCITSRLRCGEKFTSISFLSTKNRKVNIQITLE